MDLLFNENLWPYCIVYNLYYLNIFCFKYDSKVWKGEKVNTGSFSDKNKQYLRKCTVSFIYLWVSSGVFRSVGITGISHQASVFRLHVVHIDFSPSLLKCTINQYSNKSSFILEKCSFQLSGHEVLVLSLWPGRQRSAVGLRPHLPYPWYHTSSWHNNSTIQCMIHIKHQHNHEEQHFKCIVHALLQPKVPTLSHFDVCVAFSSFYPQWQVYSSWERST